MSASRNLPLYLKLAAPVVVLAALFALFVHVVWGPRLLETERTLLVEREQDVIRNIAPTLQIDLLAFDYGAIFETLRRLAEVNADERMTVALFNPEGRRLYPLQAVEPLPPGEGVIELRQGIQHEGRVLGEVVLTLDISEKLEEVQSQISGLANLVLGAGVGVLGLAILSYYWLIGQPLTTLAGVAARLGAGDFSVEIPRRVVEGTGELGDALVKLRDALRDTRADLDARAAELAASLVRYRTLQESMPGALLVLDDQGRIEEFSGAAHSVFGWNREEMRGQSCGALFPDPNCRAQLSEAFARLGNETRESEHEGLHASGARVPLRVFHRTMRIDGQPKMVVIAMDVSRIKAAEQRLLAAKEEAERANQAKSAFLSRMSHELRTPMNAILGFGQILQMDPVLARGEQKDSIDEILRAGEHLLDLINEILDLSRIEVGKLSLRSEPVSVADCVLRAVAQIRPAAEAARVGIEGPALEGQLVLQTDRTRLMQILLNLLSNAVKYNRPGGWVRLSVARQADPERLRVLVEDSGVGIAAEDLGRIFDPFERVSAHENVIEGAGIGLALTRKLVEAMGGQITVESRLGEGSRFCFELPVASGATVVSETASLSD
ncbi:MAG: PAS domain S-box protein [Rhodocyclaceae bacterium]|nr:PAS domain S-box protein [Rhodocyclaceae bacterium]